jgi:hypothetical protein
MAEAEESPFKVEHDDPAVRGREIIAAAKATRSGAVGVRRVPTLDVVKLAGEHPVPDVKLAVAKALLAWGHPETDQTENAIDLAVAATAQPAHFTGARRAALRDILKGPPGGWIRPVPGAPQNPMEWTRDHLQVVDPAPWHSALDASTAQLGFSASSLTIDCVPDLPCDNDLKPPLPVVVGTPSFSGDFNAIAQQLDPALWAVNIAGMFLGSRVLRTGYMLKSPPPGWRGGLYERANLGIAALQNVLQVDYSVSGAPGSREAKAFYYLDTSLDGQVTADDGMLWAYETAPDQVVVVFSKRLAGLEMTEYCTRMCTFLEAGLRALMNP